MNKIKSFAVAAIATSLIIPVSLSAEEMRIEKKIYRAPDLQFMFGADIRKIREEIHRYIGDDDARVDVTAENLDMADRPRRFVKTEKTENLEDWLSTSWWAEAHFVRDNELSEGTNVCEFCKKYLTYDSYVQPAIGFDGISFSFHNEFKSAGKDCGSMVKVEPLRFAKIRIGKTTETYTDTKDGSVVMSSAKFKIDCLEVCSYAEFYGLHLNEEKERVEKFKKYMSELRNKAEQEREKTEEKE